MKNIKIGDKVDVINTDFFGESLEKSCEVLDVISRDGVSIESIVVRLNSDETLTCLVEENNNRLEIMADVELVDGSWKN